jgi:hypothetical protein
MYFKEWFIIYTVWFLSVVSLFFIPKQKRREASLIFLLTQFLSWIFGLLVVELGLIEYPVRELSKANATSFSFEFFVLPLLCIFFNLYFPESKTFHKKLLYYISFLLPFTIVEYFAEKYTLILKYIHWQWYTTFITMFILFYIVRSIYRWYFYMSSPFLL